MPSPSRRLIAATAACAAALSVAAPAHASRLIVVDGDHATVREDPLVPAGPQAELGPVPGRAAPPTAAAAGRLGQRAVGRALRRALRSRAIDRSRFRRYVRIYRRARSVRRHLRGARGRQLGYVIVTLERIALRGRLIPSRMPALFLEAQRNTQYWPRLPYPAVGDKISFRGSEIVFQYYAGRGLQIQPLVTFKKANLMHGACVGVVDAPCRKAGLARLLDEMTGIAVRRGRRFIAWEYFFDFDGGVPPWMSGMAQATGMQALARASQLLGRPDFALTARRALPAFLTRPPVGVRTRGFAGGVHYLQYSFAPGVYIFNAFVQSLIGLYDYGLITGDQRAMTLFGQGEPEARREIPKSDVGDWSRYSYRGPESDRSYHELLREVLQSMCSRRLGQLYCTYARRYRGYQTDPPVLRFGGPDTTRKDRLTYIGFFLSKLSAVEITVSKEGRVALHRIVIFRRGQRAFPWRPRSTGAYTVRLAAKELRTGLGLKGRTSATIEVEAAE